MCVYMCIFMCVCACICMHVHVEARGQPQVSFRNAVTLIFGTACLTGSWGWPVWLAWSAGEPRELGLASLASLAC